jgi:hypothetical protein
MVTDRQFFADHPDRKARIRLPGPDEEALEFRSLGPHSSNRRRMLVVRVPDGPHRGTLMPIPYLLFGDETLEDRDDILLPIVFDVMIQARGHANER